MSEVKQKSGIKKREKRVLRTSVKSNGLKQAKPGSLPVEILKAYLPLFDDNSKIIANAQNGLAVSAVNDLIILSGKSQKEIAALIHTTPKTLQNYALGAKKLPTLQSELLLKLFALYKEGLEIFDGVVSFNRWLSGPAFGLYNDIPNNLLTTSTGINEVTDELVRIQYGDLC